MSERITGKTMVTPRVRTNDAQPAQVLAEHDLDRANRARSCSSSKVFLLRSSANRRIERNGATKSVTTSTTFHSGSDHPVGEVPVHLQVGGQGAPAAGLGAGGVLHLA